MHMPNTVFSCLTVQSHCCAFLIQDSTLLFSLTRAHAPTRYRLKKPFSLLLMFDKNLAKKEIPLSFFPNNVRKCHKSPSLSLHLRVCACALVCQEYGRKYRPCDNLPVEEGCTLAWRIHLLERRGNCGN